VSNLHCPDLTIYDNNLARAVASPNPIGTPITVIGSPQSLTASATGGSGTYSLPYALWTLEGFDPTLAANAPQSLIKTYSFSDTGGSSTQLSSTDLQSAALPTFYWLQSSNGVINSLPNLPSIDNVALVTGTTSTVVTASMLRNDNEELAKDYATAGYSVDGPNATAFTAKLGAAQYGQYHAVGVTPSYSKGTVVALPATAGFLPLITGTMPLSSAGAVGMTQLVSGGIIVNDDAGMPDATYTIPPVNNVSDGCALAATYKEFLNLKAGQLINYATADAPDSFQPPPTQPSVTIPSYHFNDYFMFRPSGPNSIWVAISNLSWSWTEVMTLKGDGRDLGPSLLGGESYNYGTVSFSPQPTTSVVVANTSSALPIWTGQDMGVIPACAKLPNT